MNLLIDNRTDEPLTAELEDAIRRAAAEALRYEEFDEDCEISVSIVDNEEIREINRQFRSIDRATDVLSFPMLTFAEGEEAEVNENDEIMIINSDGIIIRIKAEDVSRLGRATQGVRIMKVAEDANIIAMAKVVNEEKDSAVENETVHDGNSDEEQTSLDV